MATDREELDLPPEDELAAKFGWGEGDVEVDRDAPALRFNHHHGADGKFSSGGPGGHAGPFMAGREEFPPERVAQLKDEVSSLGKSVGEDWSIEFHKPQSESEAKAVAKTEEAQRFLVRKESTPYHQTSQAGDVTRHAVGGHVVAETMPMTAAHKEAFKTDQDGWVSRQHSYFAGQKPDDFGPYKTREAADKASAKWAAAEVKRNTEKSWDKPKDLDGYLDSTAKASGTSLSPEPVGKTTFRVIMPND
jgi:hypothetical protein